MVPFTIASILGVAVAAARRRVRKGRQPKTVARLPRHLGSGLVCSVVAMLETRVQAVQWDVEERLEICKVKGRAGTVTGRAGGTVTGIVGTVTGSIVMMGGSRVGMVRGSRVGMVAGMAGMVTGMRGVGMVAGRAGTVTGRRWVGMVDEEWL